MDVVYLAKNGERNHELRYSLRSLVNLQHGRVWVAGYCPRWTRDVGRISVIQRTDKYANTLANLQAACAHPEVSERFYLFNDDFFVMKPVAEVPMYHRGTVDRYLRGRSSPYFDGLRMTAAFMAKHLGIEDPLCYGLHIPMPMEKAKVLETLALPVRAGAKIPRLHRRTLYGNHWNVGGTQRHDVKIHGTSLAFRDSDYISTSDNSFAQQAAGKYIRAAFPDPGPYER